MPYDVCACAVWAKCIALFARSDADGTTASVRALKEQQLLRRRKCRNRKRWKRRRGSGEEEERS
jgi:hypothetical protein